MNLETARDTITEAAIDYARADLRHRFERMSDKQLLEFQRYQYLRYHQVMQAYEPSFGIEQMELIKIVEEEILRRMCEK